MVGCSIKNCENRQGVLKGRKIMFFRFPRNPETFQKWLEICPVNHDNIKTNARICSDHFKDSAYKQKPQWMKDSTTYEIRKTLLPNALPTENLEIPCRVALANLTNLDVNSVSHSSRIQPSPHPEPQLQYDAAPILLLPRQTPAFQVSGRCVNNDRCVQVSTVAREEPAASREPIAIQTTEESDHEIPAVTNAQPHIPPMSRDRCEEIEKLQQKLSEMQEQLQKKNSRLKKLREKVSEQASEITYLRRKLKTTESKKYFDTKVQGLLKHIFTPKQIDRICNPTKKSVNWTIEDISSAMSFRSVSPKGYRFLLNQGFPFPSLPTLRRWSAHLDMTPGILKDILYLMHIQGEKMSLQEKLVVLSFDEVYLAQKIEIDKKCEQAVGPHKSAQVGMARGLFSNWKQPIFYKFDQPLTENILNDIISALWDIGYIVVAVVSDLGGNNLDAYKNKKIGIKPDEKCWMVNSRDPNHKIFIFADTPHLLKLLRNHFLDDGYVFREIDEEANIWEKFVNSKVVEEMMELNSKGDIKVAFKVLKEQIDVAGPKRQNVGLAAKLFSKSTARAIKWSGEHNLLKYEDWELAAYFFELVNSWFDIFNSKSPCNHKMGEEPYGVNLERQNKILDEMSSVLQKMKIGKYRALIPFQKGIIQNNRALQEMLPYLKEKFSTESFEIKYVLTSRLNQDCLENLFAYLRMMGATNDHPSALSFKYRLRWYILGKHANGIITNSKNALDDDAPLFVSFDSETVPSIRSSQLECDDEESNANDFDIAAEISDDNSICYQESHYVDEDKTTGDLGQSEGSLVEAEGLIYLAGYAAHRFRAKYPDLGVDTKDVSQISLDKNEWLLVSSDGYKRYPSENMKKATRVMNE